MTLLLISLSFFIAAASTFWLSGQHSPLKILDHPNERSLHEIPVHRTGGLGLLSGMLVGVIVGVVAGLLNAPDMLILAGTVTLLAVSFIDDLKGLSIKLRLVVQMIVAGLTVFHLMGGSGLIMLPLAIALVWMINLYNFMDGMDGFAGGMAAWGFGFLTLVAYFQGANEAALYCALIASASAGFLVLNFPPAKIFLGDAGSTLLGFFAGSAILYFHVSDLLFAGLGVLIFSPFIIDATVTLCRRMLTGEKFWLAHRTHYYQRLVQAGWGHRTTVLAEYVLMLAVGMTALLLMDKPSMQWMAMVVWLVIYAVLLLLLEKTVQREV